MTKLSTYLQLRTGLLEEEEGVWPVLSYSGRTFWLARAHTELVNLHQALASPSQGREGGVQSAALVSLQKFAPTLHAMYQ